MAVLIILLIMIPWPSLEKASEPVNPQACASNLRQIGQAMLLYSNENAGQYPDDFGPLLLTQDIEPKNFVCPGSPDTPAGGESRAQWAANLRAGGHLSYVYCGRGQSPTSPAAAILAYEADGNHGPSSNATVHGRTFLYADGHVAYLSAAAANHAVNELAAGHNPPRP